MATDGRALTPHHPQVRLTESPLTQSVDARRDVALYMRTERLRRALQPWPRLARSLEQAELKAIRVPATGHLFPLETLVQSPVRRLAG